MLQSALGCATFPPLPDHPERSRYVAAFGAMATGSLLVYAGLLSTATVLVVGVCIQAVGWSIGCTELYRVFRAAGSPMKTHERYLNVYLALGGVIKSTLEKAA